MVNETVIQWCAIQRLEHFSKLIVHALRIARLMCMCEYVYHMVMIVHPSTSGIRYVWHAELSLAKQHSPFVQCSIKCSSRAKHIFHIQQLCYKTLSQISNTDLFNHHHRHMQILAQCLHVAAIQQLFIITITPSG